jgi:hypothetical protein
LNRERDRDHIVSPRTALISGDQPVVAHVAGVDSALMQHGALGPLAVETLEKVVARTCRGRRERSRAIAPVPLAMHQRPRRRSARSRELQSPSHQICSLSAVVCH